MNSFFEGNTLNIEILKHEKSSYSGGETGNTIYYKIENLTKRKIRIKVEDEVLITVSNGQFDKDFYLTGFHIDEASIMPGAYRVTGAIFLDSTCGGIESKCRSGISVTDETNGINYEAIFAFQNGVWELQNCEVNDCKIKLDSRTIKSKLQKTIERLEVFEEKLGVRLENISLNIDLTNNEMSILGEIYSLAGSSISEDIEIRGNLYNNSGEVLKTNNANVYKNSFMGYGTFDIHYQNIDPNEVSKIRIYVGILW